MLLVVLCVRNVHVYREEYRIPIPELHDTLYVPPSADTSTKFWHSAKFVGLFAIFVVCATFLVLALFYFECYKFLYGYVLLATFMLLLVLTFLQTLYVYKCYYSVMHSCRLLP
ncbi:hypothetical protein GCK32_020679 [Trichostrongylus colubriformis]|uniref:Uncharacterized protein n=1 Tax=Trichostrongylus colubriformis TaxID=6319 RepID=A0AAN8FIX3_TRICO